MTSSAIILAWFLWSFGAYWGHRLWHIAMRRGWNMPGKHGERQHHIHYDKHRRHDKPDWTVGPPLVPACVVWLFISGCVYPWLGAPFLFTGVICIIIDFTEHRAAHRTPASPRAGETSRGGVGLLTHLHDIHHNTHHHNYAMCTGFVWDWLFGTLQLEDES